VGSPRENGNTNHLVEVALKSARESGADTELVNLHDKDINPCIACDICIQTGECAIYDDIGAILDKMLDSDAIILASPVYFGNVTAQLKMLMDRTRPLRRDFKLKNKIGGAISVGGSRNGGQETTINAIHEYFMIHEALVAGDSAPTAHYGGTGVGRATTDTQEDEVGLETSKNLGKRLVEVANLVSK
jgi:multimeric flavodoxin WrbA